MSLKPSLNLALYYFHSWTHINKPKLHLIQSRKLRYVYQALVHFVKRCTRVWMRRRRGVLLGGALCFGLVWSFWYIHDALALCSWRICHWWWFCSWRRPCSWCPSSWWILSMEAWGDFGGWWCYFDWWHGGFEVTLEDDDVVLLCLMIWSFDGGLTWWCFGGLDDGGSCAFLLYILPVSWSLPPLRVGSLKPLLVGSKRTLVGPSEELELLFQLELKDLRRLKSSTCQIVSMVFINE